MDIGQLGMTEDLEFYKLFGGPGMLPSSRGGGGRRARGGATAGWEKFAPEAVATGLHRPV